jgi:hypothetical protein
MGVATEERDAARTDREDDQGLGGVAALSRLLPRRRWAEVFPITAALALSPGLRK